VWFYTELIFRTLAGYGPGRQVLLVELRGMRASLSADNSIPFSFHQMALSKASNRPIGRLVEDLPFRTNLLFRFVIFFALGRRRFRWHWLFYSPAKKFAADFFFPALRRDIENQPGRSERAPS
jgi:hypothetical protein